MTAVQDYLERRVYPRVCGGTGASGAHYLNAEGLSPRVRGNQCLLPVRRLCVRSIPACAGEPKKAVQPCDVQGVYPRVCGGTWMVRFAM